MLQMETCAKKANHISVVISPLRSLMSNQVQKCKDLGVKALWYRPESTTEELECCQYIRDDKNCLNCC